MVDSVHVHLHLEGSTSAAGPHIRYILLRKSFDCWPRRPLAAGTA